MRVQVRGVVVVGLVQLGRRRQRPLSSPVNVRDERSTYFTD